MCARLGHTLAPLAPTTLSNTATTRSAGYAWVLALSPHSLAHHAVCHALLTMHDLCNLCRCTQAAVAACLVACIAAAAGSPVPGTGGLRLRVNGSNLIDPTSGQPVRLTGFNWPLEHVHDGDGAYMKVRSYACVCARVCCGLGAERLCFSTPRARAHMHTCRLPVRRPHSPLRTALAHGHAAHGYA